MALASAATQLEEIVAATARLREQVGRARSSAAGDARASHLVEALSGTVAQLHSETAELARRVAAGRRALGVAGVGLRPSEAEEGQSARGGGPRQIPVEPPSEGVRLLITQMAVSGSSREQIAARLRHGFQIAEAEAVIDHVLGSDSR